MSSLCSIQVLSSFVKTVQLRCRIGKSNCLITLLIIDSLGDLGIDDQTIGVYNQRKEEYLSWVDRNPSDSLLDFIKLIKSDGLVLDLGCGPGLASACMKENGLRPDAVDASSEMVALANKTYQLGARLLKFSDISGEEVYDGIWANFSLLHVTKHDFKLHLRTIYEVLKPTGFFSIGMKLGQGEERDRLGRFYAYYTESELIDLLRLNQFSLCKTYYGEERGLAGVVEPWIVLRLQK